MLSGMANSIVHGVKAQQLSEQMRGNLPDCRNGTMWVLKTVFKRFVVFEVGGRPKAAAIFRRMFGGAPGEVICIV